MPSRENELKRTTTFTVKMNLLSNNERGIVASDKETIKLKMT
jgi:hypothetical protein